MLYIKSHQKNQKALSSTVSEETLKRSAPICLHSPIDAANVANVDALRNPLAKKVVAHPYGIKPVIKYEYSFGYDGTKPFINLTNNCFNIIGLISANSLILYNYEYGRMIQLSGHINNIGSVAMAEKGRWLATFDAGNNNHVVIWDLISGIPIKNLQINNIKATNLTMSQTGKYLVLTLNDHPQVLLFYRWSSKRSDAEAIVRFDKNVSSILEVSFSKRCEEYLVVTAANSVIFLTFNGKTLECHNPKEHDKWPRKRPEHVCSVYHEEINACYTAGTKGVLTVWGDKSILEELHNEDEQDIYEKQKIVPLTNELDGRLFINFHDYTIVSMCFIDRYLVCLDEKSVINFYDLTMRMVYSFKELSKEGILKFQMNSFPRKFTEHDDHDDDDDDGGDDDTAMMSNKTDECSIYRSKFLDQLKAGPNKGININSWRDIGNKLEEDENLLKTRDMIIQTRTNKLYYLNPITEKMYRIFSDSIHDVNTVDCSPLWTTLCIGTDSGYLYLYNYINYKKLSENKICGKNNSDSGITALKYSPNGYILACGLSDGTIYCLHPYTLQESLYSEKYSNRSKAPIHLIEFCKDSTFMAYADRNMVIGLFLVARKFTCIGFFRAHYAQINDITFATLQSSIKLYTVGNDRCLNEFDVIECLSRKGVDLLRRVTLSLEALPLTVNVTPISEKLLIISMSNFLFHTIDTDTMQLENITKSASLISPVHMFTCLNSGNISGDKFYLFASGTKIGVMKGPIDGNPFKWVSIITGTSEIRSMAFSKRSSFAFTVTEKHPHVHMWHLQSQNLDYLEKVGGEGLIPFYALLRYGRNNPILDILEDMYCLTLIQHEGAYTMNQLELKNNRKISLCELPNLLRALGVFLTNAEIEEIINIYTYKSKSVHEQQITFEDVSILFCNLQQDDDYTYDRIKEAFHIICAYYGAKHTEENPSIDRDDFIKSLETEGEKFTPLESYNYFRILTGHKEGDHYYQNQFGDLSDYKFLPQRISFKYFAGQLLGFDAFEEEPYEVEDPRFETKLNTYSDEPIFIKAMSQLKQSHK